MYSEILLLELSDICSGDVAIQTIRDEALSFLNDVFGLQDSINVIEQESHYPAISELEVGLAMELEKIKPSLSSTLKLHCSKTIIELVNASSPLSSDHLPKSLRKAWISKTHRLVFRAKSCKIGSCPEKVSDFRELLRTCLGSLGWQHMEFILKDHQLSLCCSSWILAKTMLLADAHGHLIHSYFSQQNDNARECGFYCEALKLFHRVKISGPLKDFANLLRLPTAAEWMRPTAKLYYLENSRKALVNHGDFSSIYATLGEQDFMSYFSSLSESLSMAKANGSAWLQQLPPFDKSLLLGQEWDIDDVPTSFDLLNPDDHLYALIRDTPNGSSLHYLKDIATDPASKFVIETKQDGTDLVSLGVALWKEACTPEDQLRLIKAVEVTGNQRNDRTLMALSKQYRSFILWRHGDHDRAARTIIEASLLIDHRTREANPSVYNSILLRAAKYAWKSRQRPASQIKSEFLDQIDMATVPIELESKAAHCFASFFDEQYQRLSSSELLQSRKKLLAQSQREMDNLNRFLDRATPKDIATFEANRKALESQVAQDLIEIENVLADREQYALRAAENYLYALSRGDKYDMTIFRLCALWFSFKRLSQMNRIIDSSHLPLHKIIPLMYQLAARCEKSDSAEPDCFQSTLQTLLYRALVSHPHHSLYQLLALRAIGAGLVGSKRKLVVSGSLQERRSAGAASIIIKAKASGVALGRLITDTEKLWAAYIEMASHELPLDTSTKITHPFEPRWTIRAIRDLSCPVPTAVVPLRAADLNADEIDTVVGFAPEGFRVVGGINMPKIIECRGSSGKLYRQLVKGRDDVRQVTPCIVPVMPKYVV